MSGPSPVAAGVAPRAWERFRPAPWRRAGRAPVTAGPAAAGAALVASTAAAAAALAGVAAAALSAATRLHPLWLLGAGAVLQRGDW